MPAAFNEKMEESEIKKILIGGFPCTKFSVAQKNNREKLNFPIEDFLIWKRSKGLDWYKYISEFEAQLSEHTGVDFKFGEGIQLFFNCVVAKEKMNPDYFIFENVNSMDKGIKEFIQKILECNVTETNAALVSAQSRKRTIFHNCGIVPVPQDKGVLLKDILESGVVDKEKAYCLKHQAGNTRDYLKKHHTQVAFEPVCIAQRGRKTNGEDAWTQQFEVNNSGKINALTTVQKDNMICEPIILNDTNGKSQCLRSTMYKDGMRNLVANDYDKRTCVAEPIRLGDIGSNSQAHRVYSSEGKLINLVANGGGQGAKTGLYFTPIDTTEYKMLSEKEMDYMVRDVAGGRTHFDFGYIHNSTNDKSQCVLVNLHKGVPYNVLIQKSDGTMSPVYYVKDGYINYKDKLYAINLPDGFYIIRKLTPIECERLQTLPDNYTQGVSDTQRYKMIGNGWCKDDIKRFFAVVLKDVDMEESVICHSFYDGISTGRLIFDDLGYKNLKYTAYEVDQYAIKVSKKNFSDVIQLGDAFQVRDDNWSVM